VLGCATALATSVGVSWVDILTRFHRQIKESGILFPFLGHW
jgi:hypothetical protein